MRSGALGADHRAFRVGLAAQYQRLDPTAHVDGIVSAAAQRGLPLAVLDVRSDEASQHYRDKLVLVRPDQHVAWR